MGLMRSLVMQRQFSRNAKPCSWGARCAAISRLVSLSAASSRSFWVDYDGFVALQTQAALHHVATSFPYDSHGQERLSLSGDPNEVAETLRAEPGERLATAGIEVTDVRLRRIAYAPEVAGNVLRRQQAAAVVGARYKIVEGALGMIDAALEHPAGEGGVLLDDDLRAKLVSNLLVVLCSEQHVQPVLNTGSGGE